MFTYTYKTFAMACVFIQWMNLTDVGNTMTRIGHRILPLDRLRLSREKIFQFAKER